MTHGEECCRQSKEGAPREGPAGMDPGSCSVRLLSARDGLSLAQAASSSQRKRDAASSARKIAA